MIKKVLFVLLLVTQMQFFAQTVDEIFNEFPFIDDLETTESYIKILEDEDTGMSQAYLAAMYFMKSRYLSNPFSKLKYFNRGKDLLDNVIEEYPNNVEYRYIRFGLQIQVPDFLRYNKDIESDFNYIISNINNEDISLEKKKKILNDLSLIENLDKDKLETIKKIYSEL